jgi:hypothetical protein
MTNFLSRAKAADLTALRELIEADKIKPVIGSRYRSARCPRRSPKSELDTVAERLSSLSELTEVRRLMHPPDEGRPHAPGRVNQLGLRSSAHEGVNSISSLRHDPDEGDDRRCRRSQGTVRHNARKLARW